MSLYPQRKLYLEYINSPFYLGCKSKLSHLNMLQKPKKPNHVKNLINIKRKENSTKIAFTHFVLFSPLNMTIKRHSSCFEEHPILEKRTQKLDKNPTKSVDVCLSVCFSLSKCKYL